jgi:hypothetical protein
MATAATAKKLAPKVVAGGKPIEVVRPNMAYLFAAIEGTAPLLQNPKTKQYLDSMIASGEGKAQAAKTIKNPEDEFIARLKQTKEEIGLVPVEAFTGRRGLFPTAARLARLKKISSTTVLAGVKVIPDVMLEFQDGLRGYLLIRGGSKPINDKHIADIEKAPGKRVPVPIYRPRYNQWGLELRIKYWPTLVSLSNLMSLLATMGEVGVGSWRPENGGMFGTFQLLNAAEVGEAIGAAWQTEK